MLNNQITIRLNQLQIDKQLFVDFHIPFQMLSSNRYDIDTIWINPISKDQANDKEIKHLISQFNYNSEARFTYAESSIPES
ncbi:unnamed protein product [Paramecium octaurelia]|uniref:Uncharacterized protein n=1 Tax=Paramecium octaurelia TaxID=43137 RepID=A0A8S1V9F1_PAROT|nr:unnamed protein product [Paramecium octaurelia]